MARAATLRGDRAEEGLGRDRRRRPRRTLRRRVRRRLGCRCRSGRLRRRIFSLERC